MGLIDYNALPNLDLFGIFSFHFILSTGAMFGISGLDAYYYYNLIFMIVLLWCIKETQTEIPLILAIRINIVLIAFDIVSMFAIFETAFRGWHNYFSMFCGLSNLIFRFVAIPIMSKMCSDKTGGINDGLPTFLIPLFGVQYGNDTRDTYEDMDNAPHQSYPKSEPVINHPGAHSFTSNLPTYQA